MLCALLIYCERLLELIHVIKHLLEFLRSLRFLIHIFTVLCLCDDFIEKLGKVQGLHLGTQPINHICKILNFFRALTKSGYVISKLAGFNKRDSAHDCVAHHLVDAGISNSALRYIDDTVCSHVIDTTCHSEQVASEVLHHLGVPELKALHKLVINTKKPERVFKFLRLNVGSHKDCAISVIDAIPLNSLLNILSDKHGLTRCSVKLPEVNLRAFLGLCPETLNLASSVVGDDLIGSLKNIATRPVVLLQPDDNRLRVGLLKVENIVDIGTSESVD